MPLGTIKRETGYAGHSADLTTKAPVSGTAGNSTTIVPRQRFIVFQVRDQVLLLPSKEPLLLLFQAFLPFHGPRHGNIIEWLARSSLGTYTGPLALLEPIGVSRTYSRCSYSLPSERRVAPSHRAAPSPDSATKPSTNLQELAQWDPADAERKEELLWTLLTSSFPTRQSSLDDYKVHQVLLKRVALNLGIQLEVVKESSQSLADILAAAGRSEVALPLNEAIKHVLPQEARQEFSSVMDEGKLVARASLRVALDVADSAARSIALAVAMHGSGYSLWGSHRRFSRPFRTYLSEELHFFRRRLMRNFMV